MIQFFDKTLCIVFHRIYHSFLQKAEKKNRKRRQEELEGKAKKSRSDSESMLDSSEGSANEDLGNEADSDDNNQVQNNLLIDHLFEYVI